VILVVGNRHSVAIREEAMGGLATALRQLRYAIWG